MKSLAFYFVFSLGGLLARPADLLSQEHCYGDMFQSKENGLLVYFMCKLPFSSRSKDWDLKKSDGLKGCVRVSFELCSNYSFLALILTSVKHFPVPFATNRHLTPQVTLMHAQ